MSTSEEKPNEKSWDFTPHLYKINNQYIKYFDKLLIDNIVFQTQ